MKFTILLFLAITILLLILKVYNSKNSKNLGKPNKNFKLNKSNFYTWMNFSKNERYELSKKNSAYYLNHRKNLLKEIRNEYKNITKSKK